MLLLDRRQILFYLVVTALLVGGQSHSSAQSGGRGAGGGLPDPAGAVGTDEIFRDDSRPDYKPGLSSAATDEIVTAIVVEGNNTIPSSRITGEMITRVGRNFDPRALTTDVRRLASQPWFIDVKPRSKKTPEGRVIILRVVERPVVRYVEFLGNSEVKDSKLGDEIEIEVGSAVDPFNVEEGRRKIEELYRTKGYPRIQVSILEGNQPTDQGVVYIINEGVRQRISSVSFVGNDPKFATARRLKTRINSKPGWLLGSFGGNLNREALDADVQALTDYYRQFGFYMARVGRVLEFDEQGEWVDIRFVINEGPRYHVRNVQFLGNEKFSESSLRSGLTLKEEAPFERTRLLVDTDWIKQLYGSQGYVYADVRAEPILLEEPGQVDLVYHIEEGESWRVGRIFVHIGGENPHTQVQTALNRISLKPGDIMDVRELRASERRLQASQLFLTDPAQGVRPGITYRIADENDDDELGEVGSTTKPKRRKSSAPRSRQPASGSGSRSQYRGQSPAEKARWWRLRTAGNWLYESPQRLRKAVDLHLVFDSDDELSTYEAQPKTSAKRHVVFKPPVDAYGRPIAGQQWAGQQRATGWSSPVYLPSAAVNQPPHRTVAARPEFRGQSPSVYSEWAAPRRPASGVRGLSSGSQLGVGSASAASPTQPAVAQAGFTAPATAQPTANQAVYTAPQGVQPGGQIIQTQGVGFPAPTTAPGAPAPRVIGAPYVAPNVDPTVLPLPGPNGLLFPDGSFGAAGAPYPDRAVDIHINAQEGQTGRFSIGAGINSDAGVVGNIVLDERNFDIRRWPGGGNSFANGTAFRGRGQRFRLEAAPGSQVQRYLGSFTEPFLFDTPITLTLAGSLFDRRFEDFDEQRLGGRVALGYQWVENDLSASVTYRGEDVTISDPVVVGVPELDDALGSNTVHGFGVRVANDTRNNPFLATEGHFIEVTLEQVVGDFDYSRAIVEGRKYFLLHERPDHSGRHVIQVSSRLGFTGNDTPIFDNFFAGGFSTLRGFDFRGASPVDVTQGTGVDIGGEFLWISSVEYLFPLTADDTIHGVVFCDFGTVEEGVTIEDFRVAPGFGLRLAIPALGPAPIALDFAFAVNEADTDDTQVFTFNVGFLR